MVRHIRQVQFSKNMTYADNDLMHINPPDIIDGFDGSHSVPQTSANSFGLEESKIFRLGKG